MQLHCGCSFRRSCGLVISERLPPNRSDRGVKVHTTEQRPEKWDGLCRQ